MTIQTVHSLKTLRWWLSRADFFRLKAVECKPEKIIESRGLEEGGKVQQFIDSECLRLCEPKVPKRDNILIQSGRIHTKIGSGQLEYRTPYARRWYYQPANFNQAPERGNYWFERMKSQYKEQILKGAQRIADGG